MHYRYIEKELDELLKKENNNFKTVAFTRKELKKIKEAFSMKNLAYHLLEKFNDDMIKKSLAVEQENFLLKKQLDSLTNKVDNDNTINIQDGI